MLLSQQNLCLGSGTVRLFSKDEAKRYLKSMADYYQKESDELANTLGGILRSSGAQPEHAVAKQEKDKKEDGKAVAKGWVKMGSVMVNSSDPATAKTEVLFQLLKEYRLKLGGTADALRSFDDTASMSLPDSSEYTVFIKNGIPERVIVSQETKRLEVFAYEARFRVT